MPGDYVKVFLKRNIRHLRKDLFEMTEGSLGNSGGGVFHIEGTANVKALACLRNSKKTVKLESSEQVEGRR